MRVMIAGSKPDNVSEEFFCSICRDIAEELAQRNVTIILGSERSDTADFYFFSQLKDSQAKCSIKFFYHDGKVPPFQGKAEGMNVEYERVTGGWGAGRIPQISEADVIITVGGADKTQILGTIAYYLKRPLVPIFASGGASADLWERLRPSYSAQTQFTGLINRIETWNGRQSAAACADFAERSIGLLSDRPIKKILFTYGLAGFFIALWLWCFYSDLLAPQIALYFVAMSAGLLGTLVPILIEMISGQSAGRSWLSLIVRPAAAMIMAFILYVTYLFSGYVVNGDLQFFGDLKELQSFRRVALVLSIIGLSSGVLIDNTLKSIANKGLGLPT